MPQTTERYKQFLTNYNFFSNCVQFRIHSSNALEKWKNVQSFQLDQIVNGKFYFAQDRREILLLQYDLWSRWLYEIENLCIELSGNHLDFYTKSSDIAQIVELALKTSDVAGKIMTEHHNDRFDNEFVLIWNKVHNVVNEYMLANFNLFEGMTYDTLFTSIADVLVEAHG